MKTVVCIEDTRFYIESDSSQIRDEELYCSIKSRINKIDNLPRNSFDWQSLYADAELMAKGIGIDLIIASYFTVAAFKTHGFGGFANGLTMINSALLNQTKNDLKQQKLNRGLVDWIQEQIITDFTELTPSYDLLRDLYRCERECQILGDILYSQLEANNGCFEGVTLELLKHIERLEMSYHRRDTVAAVEAIPEPPRNKMSFVLIGGVIGAVLTFVVMTCFTNV